MFAKNKWLTAICAYIFLVSSMATFGAWNRLPSEIKREVMSNLSPAQRKGMARAENTTDFLDKTFLISDLLSELSKANNLLEKNFSQHSHRENRDCMFIKSCIQRISEINQQPNTSVEDKLKQVENFLYDAMTNCGNTLLHFAARLQMPILFRALDAFSTNTRDHKTTVYQGVTPLGLIRTTACNAMWSAEKWEAFLQSWEPYKMYFLDLVEGDQLPAIKIFREITHILDDITKKLAKQSRTALFIQDFIKTLNEVKNTKNRNDEIVTIKDLEQVLKNTFITIEGDIKKEIGEAQIDRLFLIKELYKLEHNIDCNELENNVNCDKSRHLTQEAIKIINCISEKAQEEEISENLKKIAKLQNQNDSTIMLLAALFHQSPLFKMMERFGADKNTKNKFERSPISIITGIAEEKARLIDKADTIKDFQDFLTEWEPYSNDFIRAKDIFKLKKIILSLSEIKDKISTNASNSKVVECIFTVIDELMAFAISEEIDMKAIGEKLKSIELTGTGSNSQLTKLNDQKIKAYSLKALAITHDKKELETLLVECGVNWYGKLQKQKNNHSASNQNSSTKSDKQVDKTTIKDVNKKHQKDFFVQTTEHTTLQTQQKINSAVNDQQQTNQLNNSSQVLQNDLNQNENTNPTTYKKIDQNTKLFHAIIMKRPEDILKALHDGADITAKDGKGRTAIKIFEDSNTTQIGTNKECEEILKNAMRAHHEKLAKDLSHRLISLVDKESSFLEGGKSLLEDMLFVDESKVREITSLSNQQMITVYLDNFHLNNTKIYDFVDQLINLMTTHDKNNFNKSVFNTIQKKLFAICKVYDLKPLSPKSFAYLLEQGARSAFCSKDSFQSILEAIPCFTKDLYLYVQEELKDSSVSAEKKECIKKFLDERAPSWKEQFNADVAPAPVAKQATPNLQENASVHEKPKPQGQPSKLSPEKSSQAEQKVNDAGNGKQRNKQPSPPNQLNNVPNLPQNNSSVFDQIKSNKIILRVPGFMLAGYVAYQCYKNRQKNKQQHHCLNEYVVQC